MVQDFVHPQYVLCSMVGFEENLSLLNICDFLQSRGGSLPKWFVFGSVSK